MRNRDFEALPSALTDHVGYLLVVLGKRAQRAFAAALEADGLRAPHFDIVSYLHERKACSQAEIARALALEPAHLVSLLDELEKSRLVLRSPDPADRRRYSVALTAYGSVVIKRLFATALAVESDLLGELSQKEQAQLRKLLQRMTRTGDHPSHSPRS